MKLFVENNENLELFGMPVIDTAAEGKGIKDLLEFASRISPEGKFSGEEMFAKYKEMSFEEILLLLVRANGILRSIPIGERQVDGHNVVIGGDGLAEWTPPQDADKPELLRRFVERSQQAETPDEAAKILCEGIIILHIFKDANGRLSRIVSHLFKDGLDPNDISSIGAEIANEKNRIYPPLHLMPKINFILLKEDFRELQRFSKPPRIISSLRSEDTREELERYLIDQRNFKAEDIELVRKIMSDPWTAANSVLTWLSRTARYPDILEEILSSETDYPRLDMEMGSSLIERLTPEDFKEISAVIPKLKQQAVQAYIDEYDAFQPTTRT